MQGDTLVDHLSQVVEQFNTGQFSEDQAIASIVSAAMYITDRNRSEIVGAWRQLAQTGKLSAEKAYHVGCIAIDSEVWTTLFRSKVFQGEQLIDHAKFASQGKEKERGDHTSMWQAVATTVDIKLISVEQMFFVAERAYSSAFSQAVLTSGRLSVDDVLTRGWNVFRCISNSVETFKKFLRAHFEADFWDKKECLSALARSKSIAAFSWVVEAVELTKEDLDQVLILAQGLKDEQRNLDDYVIPFIIKRNLHSTDEVLAIIDTLADAENSRLALLVCKGVTLSFEEILDIILRQRVTDAIFREAQVILQKKKIV